VATFCKKVKGKSVLFVGDSLLDAMYESLMWQQGVTPIGQWQYGKFKFGDGNKICSGSYSPTKVLFNYLRNDHITVSGHGAKDINKPLGSGGKKCNVDWKVG
jgi:hypothetical protein